MEEKIMVNVSLEDYSNGIQALAKIDTMRRFTETSTYGPSSKDIASILGFELSATNKDDE